jgi:hypothetical protein
MTIWKSPREQKHVIQQQDHLHWFIEIYIWSTKEKPLRRYPLPTLVKLMRPYTIFSRESVIIFRVKLNI